MIQASEHVCLELGHYALLKQYFNLVEATHMDVYLKKTGPTYKCVVHFKNGLDNSDDVTEALLEFADLDMNLVATAIDHYASEARRLHRLGCWYINEWNIYVRKPVGIIGTIPRTDGPMEDPLIEIRYPDE